MILNELKRYYDRVASDPESDIAPPGWEKRGIPFILVLDRGGNLVAIDDMREMDGKRKIARSFIVPQGAKRSSGVAANLLWDNAAYVLGMVDVTEKSEEEIHKIEKRAEEQHAAFIRRIEEELPRIPETAAILKFLSTVNRSTLNGFPHAQEILETNAILSFRFQGEKYLVADSPSIKQAIEAQEDETAEKGICLVTGEEDEIASLHTAIKGVRDAQSTGGNIVSFNLKAFESYGKSQGYNAPVGKKAMFAYTTALNTLLASKNQKILIGDATTVFWSDRACPFEDQFAYLFDEPSKDDPNAKTELIQSLFDSPKTGAYSALQDNKTKFFLLGLSPNAARISIRFWKADSVATFAKNIRQHFEDIMIVKSDKEPRYYSLWRLLVNIAIQGDSKNIPPNLAGDMMKAIVDGSLYPQTVLQAAIRRSFADVEKRMTPARAAVIKAYLNRYYRLYPDKDEKEITMALDKDQPSLGYQLGRLFAVLEKVQEEASPGINATIADRYYSAACTAPVTVFSTLIRLSRHHLSKIENKGREINLNKLVTEIMGNITEFPSHLNLKEQGRFAVGYYHQRQDFFVQKDK